MSYYHYNIWIFLQRLKKKNLQELKKEFIGIKNFKNYTKLKKKWHIYMHEKN